MKTLNIKIPGASQSKDPITIPVKTTADAWSLPKMRDLIQGGITAALTSIVFLIQQTLEAGQFKFDWREVGMAAVAGIVAYIARKLPQRAKVIIDKKDLEPEK